MSLAQKVYASRIVNKSENESKKATTVYPRSFGFEKSSDRMATALSRFGWIQEKANPPKK